MQRAVIAATIRPSQRTNQENIMLGEVITDSESYTDLYEFATAYGLQ